MRLMAIRKLVDQQGVGRAAGEEWLLTTQGSYLPGVDEKVVGMVSCIFMCRTQNV